MIEQYLYIFIYLYLYLYIRTDVNEKKNILDSA